MTALSKSLELDVVELMEKYTATRLAGLVGRIWELANPKSGGARRKVHSHPRAPQPCPKCNGRQGRRGGKDCDVQPGIIQFNIVW